MRTFFIISALITSLAAMVWSAAPPARSPALALWEPVNQSWREVRLWFGAAGQAHPDWEVASQQVLYADADRGADLMVDYGCGSCHVIPGIRAARGTVGPSLHGFANRSYVAGILPNRPGALTRWLIDPPAHAPQTAMPDMGIQEGQARDMAAYLYSLGDTR